MENHTHKSFFNWSGGKDSALALFYARQNHLYSIEKLLTNVNEKSGRISMHGVRESLLERQAQAIGLPLQKVILPEQPSMAAYEECVNQTLAQLKSDGFNHCFFGDIFLEDLKKYREDQLSAMGMSAIFPLWNMDTTMLVNEFIELGFKAIVVCVQADTLSKNFAGRLIDKEFLKDLPAHADPCGENGEFHSFVFDGPIFNEPVSFCIGETTFKSYRSPSAGSQITNGAKDAEMGFWFTDLVTV